MKTSSSVTLGLLSAAAPALAQYYDGLGFGAYQSGGVEFNNFRTASLNTNYSTAFPFVGFNFTNITIGTNIGADTNSTETWNLHYNFSTVNINGVTHANRVLSLTFPEEELPNYNTTDWQMCTSITNVQFPAKINNIAATNDGSCVPYFGQQCYDDYLAAYTASIGSPSIYCPSAPNFNSISSCKDHFGSLDQTTGTGGIMNTTDSDVMYLYSNRTYVNATSGQVITDPIFHGLQSNDPISWYTYTLVDNSTAGIRANASSLMFTALGVVVSPQYRDKVSEFGGYIPQNNPRLFCGRAEASSSGGPISGAISLRGNSISAIFIALVVSTFWMI